MINLLNGCSRSEFSVIPKNWDKASAKLSVKWRVHYRFYDPASDQKVKQIALRGMNAGKTLLERQQAVKVLLQRESELIDVEGFNPITRKYMKEEAGEVSEHTHFFAALDHALDLWNCVPAVKAEVRSGIGRMKASAEKLMDQLLQCKYTELKIAQVRRKHLVYILRQCAKDYNTFSNYRQNKYRGFLLQLFKRLLVLEVVDSNPAKDIPIEKHTYKKRALLTPSERLIIDTKLKPLDYPFWRYIRIFFRSGSRHTELLNLKNNAHVDLEAQEFTIMVKKGKHYREEIRPIPDDILPLWIDVLNETPPGEYLFSTFFKPGPKRILSDNPCKYWKHYVKNPKDKGGMGIDKDLNSLRNLNLDTIDELRDLKHAAAAAGHADEEMVKKHYAVNNEKRMREELKGIKVDFA